MSKKQIAETTATPETQGKHYEVDITKCRPLQRAGGNPRTDYGDLISLAIDIYTNNGVTVPLLGFRVSDDSEYEWEVVAGHRRHGACKLLLDGFTHEGKTYKLDIVRVKIMSIGDARKVTDEMILKAHLTTNSGKEFTPVETAETLKRLNSVCGYGTKELAALIGKSQRYVQNLLLLAGAPKRIRDMVSSKTISYTLVLNIFRDSVDFNDACAKIESALGLVKKAPKPFSMDNKEDEDDSVEVSAETHGKVTQRHLNKVTNKVDSVKELQIILQRNANGSKTPANEDFYLFLKKLVSNQLTASQIETELFN